MTRVLLRHVALPALAPASVVGLYFTPVMVFGCVNRGLMAVAVVLASSDAWLTTLILLSPIALLFGPLG